MGVSYPLKRVYYMKNSNINLDDGKLLWACRRGMLELDLLLLPYAKEVYPKLSIEDQQAFWQFLQCPDQDLFDWLMGKKLPEHVESTKIVTAVLSHARKLDIT